MQATTSTAGQFARALATAALLAAAPVARAATSTVSTVAQLTNALAVALTNREDDVVNVAAGTYSLTSTLTYNASTNENKSLTIQCVGGGATIDAGTISVGIMRGLYITTSGNVSHVTLNGLTVANARLLGNEGSGAGMFVRALRASLTLQNCVLKNNIANEFLGPSVDAAGAWVRIDSTPGVLTVRDCVFSNNYASGTGGGLYVTITGGTTGRIFNCLLVTNRAASHGGGAYVNVVNGQLQLDNNTFMMNWTGAGTGGGGAYARVFLDTDTALARNNVFYTNIADNAIGHDVFFENDPDGNATGSLISVFNNDYGDLELSVSNHATFSFNTNGNPLLAADAHLKAGSPCIDTGTNLSWHSSATDVDGQDRLFNGRVDMGVDEAVVDGVTGTVTNGAASLTWDAVATGKYQLQVSTNLANPTWQNVGSVVTSATRTLTTSATNLSDSCRTYRLQAVIP